MNHGQKTDLYVCCAIDSHEMLFDNFLQNRNQPWQHTKKIRIFKNAVDPFFFIIRCRSLACRPAVLVPILTVRPLYLFSPIQPPKTSLPWRPPPRPPPSSSRSFLPPPATTAPRPRSPSGQPLSYQSPSGSLPRVAHGCLPHSGAVASAPSSPSSPPRKQKCWYSYLPPSSTIADLEQSSCY